jgi:hypothetical protein
MAKAFPKTDISKAFAEAFGLPYKGKGKIIAVAVHRDLSYRLAVEANPFLGQSETELPWAVVPSKAQTRKTDSNGSQGDRPYVEIVASRIPGLWRDQHR